MRLFYFFISLLVCAGIETTLLANGAAQTLAPGSVIRLSSANEQSMNVTIELDWNGDAAVPLCGKMRLAGLLPDDALEELRLCLARFFKKKLELSIQETSPRQLAIRIGKRGEAPKEIRAAERVSIASLMAKEGLPVEEKTIIRLLSPYGMDLVASATSKVWSQPFQWRGGESVVVETASDLKTNESFDVLGEVRKPGKYQYKPSQTVIDVLRDVQGPTPQASFDSVFIYRHMKSEKIETTWDDKSHKIEPGDIILVPSQKEGVFDKSLRWSSSILAIVNTMFLILLARR
ncbi:MAG: SLBB domain-containing protein [Silvanigrellaceae bacterium]